MTTLSAAQRLVLKKLGGEWLSQGPNVALLEGFPGVGKSRVADTLIEQARGGGYQAVRVQARAEGGTPIEDLLLDLAAVLYEEVGVDLLNEGGSHGDGLDGRLAGPRSIS